MIKQCSICKDNKNYPTDFNRINKKKLSNDYYYSSYCKKCSNKKRIEYNIKTGKVKQSNDMRRKKMLGKRFGNLIILDFQQDKGSRLRYLCQCDCGNKKLILADNVIHKTKSCGCLKRRKGKNNPHYTGYKNISGKIWGSIKQSAKKRNIKFSITIEYACGLFEKQNSKCILSGLDLYFSETSQQHIDGLTTASLDRINSSKGYIKGNVQWVHKDINQMKWTYKQERFIELCRAVINNNPT